MHAFHGIIAKMKSRFQICLHFVLHWEGGYVNDPIDPGGATMRGVTQATYDAFRRKWNVPIQAVHYIAPDELGAIYEDNYWLRTHCQGLLPPLDLAIFDTAVNFGPGRAIQFLCIALDITPTSMSWTEKMSLAVHQADPKKMALSICDQRDAFRLVCIKRHPALKKFLKGWQNRDNSLRNEVRK